MLNLIEYLNRFSSANNKETATALYMTNLTWISPRAYLNIIYKAAPPSLCDEVGDLLQFPSSLFEFYKAYNGANLYFDGLRIYGCVPEDQPIDRGNRFALPPFSITTPNEQFSLYTEKANLLCIGSYGYDRSMVCMNRNDQSIVCFKGTKFSEKRKIWSSLETWIKEELLRLSNMFSTDGHMLVAENLLIPGLEN